MNPRFLGTRASSLNHGAAAAGAATQEALVVLHTELVGVAVAVDGGDVGEIEGTLIVIRVSCKLGKF